MTVGELKRKISKQLSAVDAQHEAQYMLCTLLSYTQSELLLHERDEMADEHIVTLNKWVEERLQQKPLAYILGEWSFMGLPMKVNEHVLIPRDDTEVAVEVALKFAKKSNAQTALDLCTGSGCIAIALAHFGKLRVDATDISKEALAVAKKNAQINQVSIRFLQGDLFECCNKKYDVIVSNPPYIEETQRDILQKEVVLYEPEGALFGGVDGYDFYRRIAHDAKQYLNNGGCLVLEVGYNQAVSVKQLLKDEGWQDIKTYKDIADIDRVVSAILIK